MKNHRLVGILLALALGVSLLFAGCAQRELQTLQGTKVTVKGKVHYMKSLGGHFVMGEDPPGEYMIVNKDPKLLEELMKSGKTVIIDGHYTIGADYLFIEKIDGKAYQGKE